MASEAENGGQQWGITAPVSMALPTDRENKLNSDLMEELKRQNMFEAPEGVEKRKAILKHLQEITIEFVKAVGTKRGLSKSVIENSGGVIATFGSYRLGAYNPGMLNDDCALANV